MRCLAVRYRIGSSVQPRVMPRRYLEVAAWRGSEFRRERHFFVSTEAMIRPAGLWCTMATGRRNTSREGEDPNPHHCWLSTGIETRLISTPRRPRLSRCHEHRQLMDHGAVNRIASAPGVYRKRPGDCTGLAPEHLSHSRRRGRFAISVFHRDRLDADLVGIDAGYRSPAASQLFRSYGESVIRGPLSSPCESTR